MLEYISKTLDVVPFLKGPFKLMVGAAAGLHEVITYADFEKKTSMEAVEDEATLEDEPDEQDIQDLISGNFTFNESRLTVLQQGEKKITHSLGSLEIFVLSFFSF